MQDVFISYATLALLSHSLPRYGDILERDFPPWMRRQRHSRRSGKFCKKGTGRNYETCKHRAKRKKHEKMARKANHRWLNSK